MFDLTSEIQLEPRLQKKYSIARAILHFAFMLTVLFVSYRILFPIVPLDFNMDTPTALKNSLVSPRLAKTGEFPPKKLVAANDELLFNANPIGQFSDANISFITAENSGSFENTAIKIRKSYEAFFYPIGEAVGFKDGTLLFTQNGDYYIISNGLLRKFSNTDIILTLGYPKSAFMEVSEKDLISNEAGVEITGAENYPDDSLFMIDDNYYQLQDQQLYPFVSPQAYLSQFDAVSAIAKDASFLLRYPAAETSLGFADGTLVSSADSVFFLSNGKSYPIENEVTFASMGFDWNVVKQASSSELGAYEKQKQFTHNHAHLDGTVFFDQKTSEYFLVEKGKKRPIRNEAVIKTFSKQKPIVADSVGAKKEVSCFLKKNRLSSDTYNCSADLEDLSALIGNDYQISATFPASANIERIGATFSTPITFNSLWNSLSIIKNKLKNR